jgi:hypothetical protein
LVDSTEFAEGQQTLQEQFTDKAGSFPAGGTNGQGNSAPERMSLTAELEMRTFRQAAQRIIALLGEHRPESWGFAAPSEINGAILDGLPPHLLARLAENLPLDLTRTPADRLLEHFERAHA